MSQSLSRALQVLVELGDGERTLDELAASVGVHKTTVMRLLQTLESKRFVRRDRRHYQLGSRLFELGHTALEQRGIREVAHPYLAQLSVDTGGQTVHLATFENDTAVYVDKIDATTTVRMYSRVGLPAALHATAVGKVLVAALPPGQQHAIVDALDYARYTDSTIANAAALRAELALVNDRGWAEDAAEHEAFIHCVGAPVRDRGGRVVAAVSVSVPEMLMSREQVVALVPALLEATAAISAQWTQN